MEHEKSDNEVGEFIDWVIDGLPENVNKYIIEEFLYTQVRIWYHDNLPEMTVYQKVYKS